MVYSSSPTLRPWRISDLDSLPRYANNPRIAANMTDQFPHPYTVESGQKFIQYANSNTLTYTSGDRC